mmetsp:Transcript_1181/g.2449  ORF Transcript_1181/g.2449 Transcript_1181/m.2449 type:complete len:164 (-) Transcript_1181:1202-1693(-)
MMTAPHLDELKAAVRCIVVISNAFSWDILSSHVVCLLIGCDLSVYVNNRQHKSRSVSTFFEMSKLLFGILLSVSSSVKFNDAWVIDKVMLRAILGCDSTVFLNHGQHHNKFASTLFWAVSISPQIAAVAATSSPIRLIVIFRLHQYCITTAFLSRWLSRKSQK